MKNKNLNKKRVQLSINEITNKNLEANKRIDYKDVLKLITKDCDLSNYEVLTYIKELEDNDLVKFYSYKDKNKENIGLVTETYRLKLQEKMDISENSFVNCFINEALIIDLCS